ncbi:acetyl-CoA carboxylase biotin carboxyl carrier protein [Aquibium oceanicum]|uniref:Biotin carboxyl carrier protein of acetyl-CoA carboxylase n=1 Tax=Aquibium oceanicum TaxID=1670800 RepID=A0A1L3SYT6_9HYPH|nr:acetyl-CoA carboxylase biotin carboxyl carrier protein [Aquibium oceanicum]APH74558.1 acetyl-CoA carboxylase, biotin carboxyl carrier protein [Aquibium oceanicum]
MATKNPVVDQQLIRDLAGILNETNLSEIEVEQGDLRVRVSRQNAPIHAFANAPAPQYQERPSGASQVAPAATTPAPPSDKIVPSPMVGTAYAAPSPGSPPFVEIGQKVREGQTLLIIEAMKTMNQIPSPRAGTVTQILFEDTQPVEYGEPLVVIE